MKVTRKRVFSAILAVAAASVPLRAASFWDGGGGADHSWTNPLNWVPDGNPGATTDVIFASGITPGLQIELLSGVNNSANTITISTLNTFTIHSNNGAGIFLNSGTLTRQDIAGNEGNVTIDAPVSINANANWDISGFGFFTVGAIFETGATRSFTKNGSGFLEIKNVGYSGVTTLNSGTLRLDGNSSTSAINAAFGTTLELSGFNMFNLNSTVTLGGSAPAIRNVSGDSSVGRIVFTAPFGDEIDVDGGSLTVKNGINAPTGTAWVKFGSGTMVVAGVSNLDNTTLVGGGTLRAASPNALGTSVINVPANSTLDVATNLFNTVNVAGTLSSDLGGALTGQVNLTNNITLNATNFLGLVGTVSDNGSGFGITKTGAGLAQLSGTNNFLGPITVAAGNLRVNSFLASNIATTVQNGATIELFDNVVNRPLSIIGTGAGGIGALSGLGTAVWAGPITLQGDTSFGSAANASLIVSGPIGGNFNLTKIGPGTLELTNSANTFASLTIADGRLKLNSPPTLPAGKPLTVSAGGNLELSDNGIYDRPLSLAGVGGNIFPNALVNASGNNTWSGPLTLAADATVAVIDGQLTLSGNISASPSHNLTIAGPGELVLAGNVSGVTVQVSGGSATLQSNTALGANTITNVGSGATLALKNNITTSSTAHVVLTGQGSAAQGALFGAGGNNIFAGTVVLDGDTSIGVAPGSTLTLSGQLQQDISAPPNPLVKVGGGILALTTPSFYSGGTLVNAGTLSINSDEALGVGQVRLNNGGKLLIAANMTSARTFTLNSGSIGVDSGLTMSYNGATVTGGFLRGPGTHAITGTANFSGVTALAGSNVTQSAATTLNNFTNAGNLISSAPLVWDGGFNSSAGSFTINNNASVSGFENTGAITLNTGGNLTNSGNTLTSGGGGRITINSGGQLNLGATSLDLNGSLLINNGTISGTTNVNFGALAKGSGIYGAINVTDGGRFSPGNSPGTVTTGSTTWNSGGGYIVEIADASNDSGRDFWSVQGQLHLTASTAHPFTIALASSDGLVFDPSQDYDWPILHASDGIAGLDAANLVLDLSNFRNSRGSGQFSLQSTSSDLSIHFSSVPEPTMALSVCALAGLWGISRRKK